MGDPFVEFDIEKHIAALVASSTQALPSQLNISVGEDVARLRRDPYIQAALKKCDDTMDHLKRMQIQLEQAVTEINRRATAIRSSLAPVMSLPPEILSEIFSLVVYTPLRMKEEPDRVLRLAAVCTKWRYTALSARNLWSLCSVSWPEAQQVVWLARSSPGPIDVFAAGWVLAPLCPELRRQAFRWRSILLYSNGEFMVDFFDTITKLPDLRNNLQTLDFNSTVRSSGKYDARDFQSTLPKLKSVRIKSISVFNLHTVAENLTSLSLFNVVYPFTEWRKLLSSCQNLKLLLIHNSRLRDRPDNALESVVLPRLQYLTIGRDGRDGLDGSDFGHIVFDHISAPVLHSFSAFDCCSPSNMCMSMRPFLQRHHTIVALTLVGFSWAQDVFDWLSVPPDVTIDNTLIPGYNQPLPNLKHLELSSDKDSMMLYSVVRGIISARERIVSKGLDPPPKVFVSLKTKNITYPKSALDYIDERVENFVWEDFPEDS